MKRKTLITGATGFIGKNLVRALAEDSTRELYVLVRKTSDLSGLPSKGVTLIQGDITDPDSLNAVDYPLDTVFHLAAYISFNRSDYDAMMKTNSDGIKQAAKLAIRQGASVLVATGTAAIFGMPSSRPVLNDESSPFLDKYKKSGYMYSKKLAEMYTASLQGIRAVTVHPTTVYGWGDASLNSGAVVKQVYNGVSIAPPGGTSVIGVKDVVKGLLLAEEKGRHGESYIITGENLTYKELFDRIAGVLGVSGPKFILPGFTKFMAVSAAFFIGILLKVFGKSSTQLTTEMMNFLYSYRYFTSEKAYKELDFKPEQSLEEAVTEAFEYYIEKGLMTPEK